ncbi:tryptophan synthase subunit alpha [Immundisolibacter sp.]|uniref:tryptophan synthase subunit alpha n=1 Tax=Immundisolibacter sp. TaxID=1934948 RepID=UPI000ECD6316|nr:tryptophan synthase subunit alpha [Gammaproteobacteria bacterium]
MSRLAARFDALRAAQRSGLVIFVTAGDPHPELTVELLHALVAAGADVLELGVPFSDPMADGPVIQRASERALAHGVDLRRVLDLVRAFRQTDTTTPVVLMGYLNPIEQMGVERFARTAAEVGVDGVLTVDLPFDEEPEHAAALRSAGLDSIFLLAPTSGPGRAQAVAAQASGFLYYVSVRGVTGAGQVDMADVRSQVEALKAYTDLPVGVGFGVRTPQAAAQIAAFADAVVVGSAVIEKLEAAAAAGINGPAALKGAVELVRTLRAGIDTAVGEGR